MGPTALRYALGSVWAITNGGMVSRFAPTGTHPTPVITSGVLDVKFGAGAMYLLTTAAVEQVDPSTRTVMHSYPINNPVSFDVSAGTAFVLGSSPSGALVDAMDMTTGHSRTYHLPKPLSGQEATDSIATDGGNLWVIDGNTLVAASTTSLTTQAQYPLPYDGTDLRPTSSGVFVASGGPRSGIVRLQPRAAAVTPCWPTGDALQMTPDGADLWVSAAAGLTKISQSRCTVTAQAAPIDTSANGIAVLPDQVWVAFPDKDQIQITGK